MSNYRQAVLNLFKDSVNTISDDAQIAWNDGHDTTSTEATDIATEIVKINRKVEYDKLNQDEMRYDDTVNNTTTWVDAIQAIKEQFPK